MTKFMYLFRGGDARMQEMSPEEMEIHMQAWGTWMNSLAEKGTLVDGLPLSREGKLVKGSGKVITDGPFTEGKEIVGGYLIVKAKDIGDAVDISKGCPIFANDGQVEVREIMSM